MISKAAAEKFFSEIKESLTNEIYQEFGKRLENQTKDFQTRSEEAISKRIEYFQKEIDRYIEEKVREEIEKQKNADLH